MTTRLLDGRAVALELAKKAREELGWIQAEHCFTPTLFIVRVGSEQSSVAYERSIVRTGRKAGISVESIELPEGSSPDQLRTNLECLNSDPMVHGIIVLQPLPEQLSRFAVADIIAPSKDVDGITTYNAGRLFHDDFDVLAPSTPAGGMALLKHYQIPISGKRAVVVGRSSVVGKPMAMMLLAEDGTVTICHSKSRDLAHICQQADILVSAVGRANFITREFVGPGATVVDFGVNFIDGEMTGDVDVEDVSGVAGALTPVPGGTGRVTTMVLVRNTIRAARQAARAPDEP
ncbi:bifunctional 5,10-methylenetetrahydrofolate dehydrogenase/5,10-methenyltetrahydrofolate cyclohydrolase [soil metagenome]